VDWKEESSDVIEILTALNERISGDQAPVAKDDLEAVEPG